MTTRFSRLSAGLAVPVVAAGLVVSPTAFAAAENTSCTTSFSGDASIGFRAGTPMVEAEHAGVEQGASRAASVAAESLEPSGIRGDEIIPVDPRSWRFTIDQGARSTGLNSAVFPLKEAMQLTSTGDGSETAVTSLNDLEVVVSGTSVKLLGKMVTPTTGTVASTRTLATGLLPQNPTFTSPGGLQVKMLVPLTFDTSIPVSPGPIFDPNPISGPYLYLDATGTTSCPDPGGQQPSPTPPSGSSVAGGAGNGSVLLVVGLIVAGLVAAAVPVLGQFLPKP